MVYFHLYVMIKEKLLKRYRNQIKIARGWGLREGVELREGMIASDCSGEGTRVIKIFYIFIVVIVMTVYIFQNSLNFILKENTFYYMQILP